MIKAAQRPRREVGFVYLCNPNNPTGVIVTKQEVKQLLDGLPEDMPVLIDEAYHHFVDDPDYATSVPYVLEGRPVIIARTFSKIAALAGMRLGYADRAAGDDRADASVQHGQHQRDGEVGRRRRRSRTPASQAQVKKIIARPAQEDDRASCRRMGYDGDPVGGQLLHGAHRPRRCSR